MKPPHWLTVAAETLDRIESGLKAHDLKKLDDDQRAAVRYGHIHVAEARKLLGVFEDPEVAEAVAEAIYRGAWAAEMMFTPWNLDRYRTRILAPRKGGLSRKPALERRRERQRERVLKFANQKLSLKQIWIHYGVKFGAQARPSISTIRTILNSEKRAKR